MFVPDHWFFLSYARADGGEYLHALFAKLVQQVRSKAGLPSTLTASNIGFMDRLNIEPGDNWDPAVLEALQCTKIFICIISRGYIASDYCGKEFEVFRSRLSAYTARLQSGQRPTLIMPIFWYPEARIGKLPETLSGIQHNHADYGDHYIDKGLFTLSTQRRYRDDYNQFLDSFSWKLVEAARKHPLPLGSNDIPLLSVTNPFQSSITRIDDRVDYARASGPRSVRFIFVAGRRGELNTVRDQVDAYGDIGGREWRPFQPQTPQSIGALSSRIVAEEDFFPEDIPFDDRLIQRIRHSENENAIVLLIVDPWSVELTLYRKYLEDYDKENFINCGVIAVWNSRDSATASNQSHLHEKLRGALSRTCILNGYVRDCTQGPEEFQQELIKAVSEIRRRIATRGEIFQKLEASSYPLPQLAGPGSDQ